MSRPKIAVIGTVDVSMKYLLLNQMLYIQASGYDVTAFSAPGPLIADVEAAGVPHVPVSLTRKFSPMADIAALWRLSRALRRRAVRRRPHPHAQGGPARAVRRGARPASRSGVHTIHGLYFPGHMKPERRWAYVLLERVTMLFSHMNLSQNPEDIPVVIEEKISRPERVRLLGNGIDVEAFDPASRTPERRRATRASLGLGEGHKVVGVVARFVAEKGYMELLRAAEVISGAMPEARFLFIGAVETQKADALDPAVIDEMGLGGVVKFLGHRTTSPTSTPRWTSWPCPRTARASPGRRWRRRRRGSRPWPPTSGAAGRPWRTGSPACSSPARRRRACRGAARTAPGRRQAGGVRAGGPRQGPRRVRRARRLPEGRVDL